MDHSLHLSAINGPLQYSAIAPPQGCGRQELLPLLITQLTKPLTEAV